VIDVREPREWKQGHLANSTLVPLNTLLLNPQQYLTRDNILFVCAVGQRSAIAAELAAALGFQRLYNLEGGLTAWAKQGLPLEV